MEDICIQTDSVFFNLTFKDNGALFIQSFMGDVSQFTLNERDDHIHMESPWYYGQVLEVSYKNKQPRHIIEIGDKTIEIDKATYENLAQTYIASPETDRNPMNYDEVRGFAIRLVDGTKIETYQEHYQYCGYGCDIQFLDDTAFNIQNAHGIYSGLLGSDPDFSTSTRDGCVMEVITNNIASYYITVDGLNVAIDEDLYMKLLDSQRADADVVRESTRYCSVTSFMLNPLDIVKANDDGREF